MTTLSEILQDLRPLVEERLKALPKSEAKKIKKAGIALDLQTGDVRRLDVFKDRLLHTVSEASEILGGISIMSVNRYIKQGILPSVQLGSRRLIPRQALVEMIAEKTERRGH